MLPRRHKIFDCVIPVLPAKEPKQCIGYLRAAVFQARDVVAVTLQQLAVFSQRHPLDIVVGQMQIIPPDGPERQAVGRLSGFGSGC